MAPVIFGHDPPPVSFLIPNDLFENIRVFSFR